MQNLALQNLGLYFTSVFIWGTTWIAIKFQLGIVDPLLSIAYRYGLAAILFLAFLAAARRLKNIDFTRRQYFLITLQGGVWI